MAHPSVPEPVLRPAAEDDAAGMVEVIHAAFGARPALDPPSTAIDETAESVAAAVRSGAGIYATVDGAAAGAILIVPVGDDTVALQRVSVHPAFQRHGIASTMVHAALELASASGFRRVELFAREELAELVVFWRHRGFERVREEPHGVVLGRALPLAFDVPSAEDMQDLGSRIADLVVPGDVLILTGELGAGKTTLVQGLGAGLHSEGPVISPTFVISRVHPSRSGAPTLVHVDAYRLGAAVELDDLDLDASVPEAVTVVEWGDGLAEQLADSYLRVRLVRSEDPEDETRRVVLDGVGARWRDGALDALQQHGASPVPR